MTNQGTTTTEAQGWVTIDEEELVIVDERILSFIVPYQWHW
jgi:hypothetical protein